MDKPAKGGQAYRLFGTQIHPDEIEKENAFHRTGTDYQDS